MQWLFTSVHLFTTKGCFILYTQLYKYMILPSRQYKCIQDYKTFSQIYTDDIMGEAVNYTNSVIGWEVQEHHQNAQCLLLWQIMGNFARLRSTFTQCGHGPLWWHRCFFYETWQKFTHITHRKKIQGWENRGSSVWPINAIVAKTIDGFFNRCPLMRSNSQTLRRSTVKNILMPRVFLGTGQPTFMKGTLYPWH